MTIAYCQTGVLLQQYRQRAAAKANLGSGLPARHRRWLNSPEVSSIVLHWLLKRGHARLQDKLLI
jgi:hypothetical protein